ncbi:hypothetical protein Bca4012_021530 [Brassica carinata]
MIIMDYQKASLLQVSCEIENRRDEFCMTSTLKLELEDDTDDMIPFINFVNRIVAVHGPDPSPLQKFHLTLHRMIDMDEAD